MSRLSSEYGLWVLRDALFLRAEGRRATTTAPYLYRDTASVEDILQATDSLLAPLAGCRVTVRLGFPWTQHIVVPWHRRLATEAEWMTWAMAACNDPPRYQHGGPGDASSNDDPSDAPRAQHIALTPARYQAPRLAVIGHPALLNALVAQCKAHRVRLATATSTFTYGLHRYRRAIPGADSALAMHERGLLTCALRRGGAITAMTTVAAQTGIAPQIHAVLRCLALSAAAPVPDAVALVGEAAEPDDHIQWLGNHLPAPGEGGSA